ncbi:hypothetical protein GGI04_001773 [Coemansia thaxteri]|nr:hypothetical protein GGI04_001773 [Coemansia thaxteri]
MRAATLPPPSSAADDDDEEESSDPGARAPPIATGTSAVGIEPALASAAKGKKKRRLHAARTVVDVTSPASDADDRLIGAPLLPHMISGSWPPSASSPSASAAPIAAAPAPSVTPSRLSKAALPQESKQPVLFTPVRTRSKNKSAADGASIRSNPLADARDDYRSDSIFLTPMKMLNRLRHRKK